MLALSVVVALAVARSPGATTPSSKQGGTLAVKVEHIVKPDGTLGPGGWIVVKGGRLEAVGAGEAPAGAAVVEFPHGVAAPGFVDPVTALGASGDLAETARAFTPEVQAADAFDADHSDFRKAAAGGITTVGLSPSSSNVVGGHLAIVRTSGEQGLALLAAGSGPLRFALTNAAFDFERAPTSRMGALPQLREMLAGDKLKAAGPCLVDATTPDEIRIALETFGAAGRQVALLRPNGAIEPDDGVADLFKGTTALAVVGPFSLSASMRTLALPQTLTSRGVAVAFTAGGHPASLRLTAALAVRGGLPADKALQGLTAVPARVLGLDDCGSLEAGKRADLLVFDGDPLDLAAPLKLVLVGGAPQDPQAVTATQRGSERSKGTP
jgi:imidazolonepropionase-like amidohydrolase